MNDRKRMGLQQWIEMVLNDTDYETPCSAISLQHVSAGGGQEEVKTTKIGGGRSWSAQDLAQFFMTLAQGHCQDINGTQTYRLLAFYGSNEPRARHTFLVAGQTDNHGMGTESPTVEGRLMQKMRHEEALTQGMLAERLALLEYPLRTMRVMGEFQDRVMQHNRDLMRENVDAVNLAKQVMLEKATQNHTFKMEEIKLQQSMKDREMLLKFAPLVINELTGKEIIPQSTADSLLFESIVEKLIDDPKAAEKVQKLMESDILPPEALGIVMRRIQKSMEKRRQIQEEALARGNEAETDAADDPLLPEQASKETH